MTARIDYICENSGRSDKCIVLYDNPRIERNIVLDFDVIADTNAGGDKNVLPDVAVPANPRAGHDMAKMPDSGPASDLGARVNDTGRMHKIV